MHQYHELLKQVLREGVKQSNRTGIDAITLPGAMMKFDLREGYPAVTTKQLAFNAMKGELLGFIRGYSNAKSFNTLGCKIWDANANENQAWLANPNRRGEGDLGRIYGVQWRDWGGSAKQSSLPVDQLADAVHKILLDPANRRIIISAWNPSELDEMALPPCHVLYQFSVDTKNNLLHLCMYQRSCDMFLGVPFNIASASLLLAIVAKLTGYTPAVFTHFLADVHIYENHVEQVLTMLNRVPYAPPKLVLGDKIKYLTEATARDNFDLSEKIDRVLESIEPDDIQLEHYLHHPPIKADMAV